MPVVVIVGFSLTVLLIIFFFGFCLYICFHCYNQGIAEGDRVGHENGETTTPVDPEELNRQIQIAVEKLTEASAEHYERNENPCGSSECAICLEEFGDGESCRVFPNCKHMFHTNCITRWLGIHQTCPICRTQL